MKHTTKILTLFGALLISSSAWAISDTYATSYKDLDGKSGENLFNAINAVCSSHTAVSYAALWTIFYQTDAKSDGNLWDMYSNCTWASTNSQCGSQSKVCDCYNREHSLPKSWWGGSENACYTDLFHLVPTDGRVNNQRSNYAFGETSVGVVCDNDANALGRLGKSDSPITVAKSTIAGTSATCSATVFEPADEYKGDFARNYFGMRVSYPNINFAQADGGTIHFSNTTAAASATNYGLTDYSVILLLKWHRQDPVSQKEIDRNNAIETAQGNRNPFIDYPCLAEYLWGNKAGETFSTASCCGSFEANFSVGSDGCTACATSVDPSTPTITVSRTSVDCGSVVVGNTTTATFTVSGSNLTADITLAETGTGFSIDTTTLAPTDGTVASTTITVTFAPTAAGAQNGTITISSTGATNKTVSLRAVGTTAAVAPAPSTTPVVFFGTVVTDKHTFSGTTATLHLHISDLATNVTVASSNTGIFTVSTSTATDGTITPDEAAAGVTITLTKHAAGTANLTIEGGVVNKTYEITFK